jgi:thiol-disulfide isomerase/thioredoxin
MARMKFTRRFFHAAVIAASLATVGLLGAIGSSQPASAGGPVPFSPEAFKAAQAAGGPILVEIHADWCPTCKAQAPILDKLAADPKFKDLKIFRVDFDAMKVALKDFKAQSQSTLIVFKGSTERGRSVGDTRAASIAALLDKSL